MSQNDNRDRRFLSIRLLDVEAEILKRKAEEAHMSKSEFIRGMIRYWGAYPKTNFTKECKEKLQRELDRIGNNFNMIDYRFRANGIEGVDEVEYYKLKDNFYALLAAFRCFVQDKDK